MDKEPRVEDQGEAAPDVFPYIHWWCAWPSRGAARYLFAVFGEPEPPSLGVATFDDQRKVVAKYTWPGSVRDATSGALRDWLEPLRIEAEAVETFAEAWELRTREEAG